MQQVVDRTKSVASSDAPAFITGENGTGKEHIAQMLHNSGKRAAEPFIAVNCSALPTHLIESELFGSRRGSYTGSTEERNGLFIQAGQGTIFLDELAEMPFDVQSKMLHVLQDRKVRPVGETRFKPINCRIVAATNLPIKDALDSHKLRMDLYYRLAVITLHLPTLNERPEDIRVLSNFFIDKFSKEENKVVTLADGLLTDLAKIHWRGNVRQLQNAIHRAILFSKDGFLTLADFAEDQAMSQAEKAESAALVTTMDDIKKAALVKALADNNGSRIAASRQLGIARGTVYMQMEKYGLVSEK